MEQQRGYGSVALRWCVPGIVDSIQRIGESLDEFSASDAGNRVALEKCRSILHQVDGALLLVDATALRLIMGEVVGLMAKVHGDEIRLDSGSIAVIKRCLAAVSEYLEDVRTGSSLSPVALFPYYKLLLELRKVEKFDPVDLFDIRVTEEAPPLARAPKVDPELAAKARVDFESVLLAFIKGAGGADALKTMDLALRKMMVANSIPAAHTFYWLASALLDALKNNALPVDVYSKRVIAQINLQSKKAVEKGEPIAPRMIQDLLFNLARVKGTAPMAAQARAHFHLAGLVPSDFEKARYGVADPVRLAQARDLVTGLQRHWERACQGVTGELAAFSEVARKLTAVMAGLPYEGTLALIKVLCSIRGAVESSLQEHHPVAIEVATAMLFLHEALSGGLRTDGAYDRELTEMAERIGKASRQEAGDPPELPESLLELSRRVTMQGTLQSVAQELASNLQACEQALESYLRNAGGTEPVAATLPLVHQARGVFAAIAIPAAVDACDAVDEDVRALVGGTQLSDADNRRIANNLSALSFMVESIQQPDTLGGFRYDEGDRELKVHFGRRAPPEEMAAAATAVPKAAPAPRPKPAPVPTPAVSDDDGGEDELLDIFLGEAEEVLGTIAETSEELRALPANVEMLTTVRRAYHTLKGSSRMVALNEFGAAAWEVEQLLNGWLADHKPANEELLKVVMLGHTLFTGWVERLKADKGAIEDATALVNAAQKLRAQTSAGSSSRSPATA